MDDLIIDGTVKAAVDRDGLNGRISADIETLCAAGYESIGGICKTASESADAYEALKERLLLRLITKHTPAFEKGKKKGAVSRKWDSSFFTASEFNFIKALKCRVLKKQTIILPEENFDI